MFEFSLPPIPTFAELAAARYWALGGGLAGACGGMLSWLARRNMIFGEIDETPGPSPEILGLPAAQSDQSFWASSARYGAVGAVGATGFAVMTSRDQSEFAALSVVFALVAVMLALWAVVHRPAGLVPVGERPEQLEKDEAGPARSGTWGAVAFAVAGLVMAMGEYWL